MQRPLATTYSKISHLFPLQFKDLFVELNTLTFPKPGSKISLLIVLFKMADTLSGHIVLFPLVESSAAKRGVMKGNGRKRGFGSTFKFFLLEAH